MKRCYRTYVRKRLLFSLISPHLDKRRAETAKFFTFSKDFFGFELSTLSYTKKIRVHENEPLWKMTPSIAHSL